ncbi:MAG: TetR/AcrR family transcriptional regulator [Gaiellaceae bacterium]|jgi:TetR/AcrR family transcriptional regulator, transcriptional repressor of aconitase
MPKVSEAHLQSRRDQILAGARRAFARYGYEGATVARLEEETGLSRGAIFNYYRDKWALFLALAAEDQHVFIDLLVDDGLDAVIRKIADENPDWLAVYFELARRMRTDPELMREMRERAPEESRRADEFLAGMRERGDMRGDVELTTLAAFINIVTNGVALASSLGLSVDVDELLKLVHRGIDPQ